MLFQHLMELIFKRLAILHTNPDMDWLEYASLRFVLYPLPIQSVPTHAIPATPPPPWLQNQDMAVTPLNPASDVALDAS